MAKIKIKDLSKGIKVTEEELKQVRGGWLPIPIFPVGRKKPRTPVYDNYEICSYIQSMACGCPG
jgi:hypothetical protein